MTVGVQESLAFRLLGTAGELGSWGHEYVRYVCVTRGDVSRRRARGVTWHVSSAQKSGGRDRAGVPAQDGEQEAPRKLPGSCLVF